MHDLLRIVARMNVGGPARHVIRIDAPLRRRGWNTTLVTGRPGPGEGDLVDEARAAGIDVHVLPELSRAPSPARDLRALVALRRLMAARRPELVHTHTAKAGVLGRLAARACRPRPLLVHTYHGHVLADYFGRGVSAAIARIERALAARTDALVAVSPSVRDQLVGRHRVGDPGQYTIVPPGIDRERTRPDVEAGWALRAELGVPEDGVLFVCVGRLAPVKNVDLVLDAFAGVAPSQPRARLLVVGDGPSGPGLRERIGGLPGAAWRPPRHRLSAVYGAADVLVLGSDAEGLPQVVAEALAAGVPVLATAVGGVPDLLRDGRDGLLVPPRDGPALGGAMARLLDDASLRGRLAEGARSRSLEEHTAESVADRLADLYAQLLDPRVARTGAVSETALPCTSSS
ncbi:MAG: glycosyltransferase [Planctomycetota bacterium]|jgi:glycosyltransferase involved in cell wall biosynthesis